MFGIYTDSLYEGESVNGQAFYSFIMNDATNTEIGEIENGHFTLQKTVFFFASAVLVRQLLNILKDYVNER